MQERWTLSTPRSGVNRRGAKYQDPAELDYIVTAFDTAFEACDGRSYEERLQVAFSSGSRRYELGTQPVRFIETPVDARASLRQRFGERVRELRTAAGYSQEAFADRCGYARAYMSRVERGTGNPSLDTIETFATALGVPVKELFDVPVRAKPTAAAPR